MWSPFVKKQSDIPRRRSAGRDVRPPESTDIFKRNRTLTGTTSNNFNSVGVNSDLESNRSHVHNLTDHRRRIFSIFSIVIMSSVFLWLLISNFTASVVISVPNAPISKQIDKSRYEKVIQEYLDINPMGRLHFLLDESALNTYVSSKLPEVAVITQRNNMVGIGQTNFVITMRNPVAGWKIGDKQYYVDSKGISFDTNYFTSPTVQIVDNSGASPVAGTAIVSNRFLSFVGRVVAEAKSGGYIVTQAILPLNTTRELDIKIQDNSILVKLSIDRSAGEQVEDMSRALKWFASNGANRPSYIDVRVSGKAFYK